MVASWGRWVSHAAQKSVCLPYSSPRAGGSLGTLARSPLVVVVMMQAGSLGVAVWLQPFSCPLELAPPVCRISASNWCPTRAAGISGCGYLAVSAVCLGLACSSGVACRELSTSRVWGQIEVKERGEEKKIRHVSDAPAFF